MLFILYRTYYDYVQPIKKAKNLKLFLFYLYFSVFYFAPPFYYYLLLKGSFKSCGLELKNLKNGQFARGGAFIFF